ncbi:MAG: hypothetical protein ACOX9C_03625, partial [Kiritimatiellia bacterium]
VLAEACAQWAERETKVGIKPNPLKIRNLKGVQTVIFRWNFGLVRSEKSVVRSFRWGFRPRPRFDLPFGTSD